MSYIFFCALSSVETIIVSTGWLVFISTFNYFVSTWNKYNTNDSVYRGNCSCGEDHVGESVRNIVLRWIKHEDPNKQSESATHLKYFPDH